MATIFSRIIAGEIPSYKVAEDDRYYAFLDINPLTKGHTLVVPKQEVDYLFDLDDETLAGMMVFAKKVAARIKREIDCARVAALAVLPGKIHRDVSPGFQPLHGAFRPRFHGRGHDV